MNGFQKPGRGQVPMGASLFADVIKGISESVADAGLQAHEKMSSQLDFSSKGCSPEEMKAFVDELLSMEGAKEPLVQSGGIYGVSNAFHEVNGAIIVHELKTSGKFAALSQEDQKRAAAIFELVFTNSDLRNRNPLHPSVIDSCIIGNLLNFPKHIFGLPYACFASDGNEALSLALFSYRQEQGKTDPAVLYVGDPGSALPDIHDCAERLGIDLIVVDEANLPGAMHLVTRAVAVMASFDSSTLDVAAAWADRHAAGLHVHVTDTQLRKIFTENASPVHFEFPKGVRSISIEEGILHGGYMLYRDTTLRDQHLDVPYEWQTVYMSPNEGGSCTGRPLLFDFCMLMLGWSAVADIARGAPTTDRSQYEWGPNRLTSAGTFAEEALDAEQVLTWAKAKMAAVSVTSRAELEVEFIGFQQEFLGGKNQEVEGMTTGGGTRSINCAFEAVICRDKQHGRPGPRLRVLTGNPHLAVERAARRFGFEVVRLDMDGVICVDKLSTRISDPCVTAVYAQSLSFTDGTSDPLAEILKVIENENNSRAERKALPIVLINDSCLAFNVLIHNDGADDSSNMCLLELAKSCSTPVIVMNDAHKHLGTDKGLSTITGTHGILSCLKGRRRVGAQPQVPDLVRAIADMKLIGRQGYQRLYRDFTARIEHAIKTIENAGMKVLHAKNRMPGSTVIAVEDPSGAVSKKMKKKGYSTAPIYNARLSDPGACQTGWQLSLTPHHLRPIKDGTKSALEAFVEDLVIVDQMVKADRKIQISRRFLRENSGLAFLLSGNTDPFVFQLLREEGFGRKLAAHVIRRFLTAQLDSGTVCSLKRRDPVWQLSCRAGLLSLLVMVVAAFMRRAGLMKRRWYAGARRALHT